MSKNEKPVLGDEFILDNLMEHMSDAIYFKDLQSRFILINRACAEKHRWSSLDVIVGKTDFDVFSREHAEQAFADEQRIIATGEPLCGIEEKETFSDGSMAWVSTTKMPLKDREGRIIGTFGISRDITEHKEAELRALRYAEEIRLIKEEMEEDVHMAGELQKTFSPHGYPVFPEGVSPTEGCVGFFHHARSCGAVSGDYCSIQRISDTEAGIFVCDVQGTGLRAALGTALIRGIAQEMAGLGLAPGAYLDRMSQLLIPLIRHEEIPLDITACYLVLDVVSGKIRYANAGHPVPIRFRQSGDATGLSDGMEHCGSALTARSGTACPTIECSVEPGDGVVLFTDGLLSVSNATGESFGCQRLLESVGRHAAEPFATLFESLESDAVAFSATGALSDDICLIGFRLNRRLG